MKSRLECIFLSIIQKIITRSRELCENKWNNVLWQAIIELFGSGFERTTNTNFLQSIRSVWRLFRPRRSAVRTDGGPGARRSNGRVGPLERRRGSGAGGGRIRRRAPGAETHLPGHAMEWVRGIARGQRQQPRVLVRVHVCLRNVGAYHQDGLQRGRNKMPFVQRGE